jgi:PAS domain S-box-containing protein
MTTSPDRIATVDIAHNSKTEQAREATRIALEIEGLGSGTDPFAAAVRATRMPMIVTNPRLPDNPVVFANDSFCRLTGYRRDEILGRNCRFLQGPETDPSATATIRAAVAAAEPLEIDIRNHRKDGTAFWNRLLMAPVRDADENVAYYFASQVDVTLERERLAGLESHNAALIAELAGRLHAQQDSEARLRFATEAGRMGIWELDLLTGDLMSSALCRQTFGRDPRVDFTLKDLEEAIHADDWRAWQESMARAMETGADHDIECRIQRPDGSMGWVQSRAQIVLGTDGTAVRMAGITFDVTARRASEEDLRRTDALLRAILQTAPALIYAKDRAGRMVIANPLVMDLIGKPWEAVKGRGDDEFLDDPVQARIIMENDRQVMASGRTEVVEERVGEPERVWLSTKTPFRDLDGTVVGMVGVSLDITARKQAERALQELNATLESRVAERTRERDRVWNNAQDLLLVTDANGVFHSVNPAWTTILWWTPDELIGQSYLDFIHPDDHQASQEALRVAVSDPLPRFENRLRHKDGSHRWIAWLAVSEGDLVYASGRDISAEKTASAALARTEEQLRQAQKMEAVGQLTGGIAHDFNNLLTSIMGSLELVQKRIAEGRTAGLERYTSAAVTSAQRAAALTQRLLAFARRQPLDPKRVEPNRLVAGMEDLLRRTIGPAIDLEMVLSGGLWATLCDPNQLESAILNLAINARDAMPDGGRLTIETQNAYLDDAYAMAQGGDVRPGQYVAFSVSDTGIGMTPEIVEKAFDPFYTTKPIGQGTGLGLSMLYGFVKQSEGHVRIYSEPGQGTTFRLYLPRHLGASDRDAEGKTKPPKERLRAEVGETVLVVDDEATVRMLVGETLEELGYAPLEAADGAGGLRILQSQARVDLLVTDVGLPGLNGRQLADAARALRPNLKVLFITGYAHNAAIGNGLALESGMEIITKPFALDVLAAKIRTMIERM